MYFGVTWTGMRLDQSNDHCHYALCLKLQFPPLPVLQTSEKKRRYRQEKESRMEQKNKVRDRKDEE